MSIVEAVNVGKKAGMAKVGSTARFLGAIGKPMTLGRVAVGYPSSLISTMAQEDVRRSGCFKAGCPCLPPAQEKGP